jgi:hypothetical protein
MLLMNALMILLCGLYCLGMAVFHSFFTRLFNWKEELSRLSIVNKAIIRIANLRLIYFFVLVSLICFLFPDELTTTPLGRFFMIGMSVFWFTRAIEQIFFLKVNHPLIQLLTYLFLIGTILFLVPVIL